jgi:hypothetical protein
MDIESRYEELLHEYRQQHGHEPGLKTAHHLARQANLETRSGKTQARSLAEMRASWRQQVSESFGANMLGELTDVVGRPYRAPADVDIDQTAREVTMSVAAQRSTWTVWNLRAEAERVLRFQHRFTSVGAHTTAAEAVVAQALAEHCISVEPPSLIAEPESLRRADGASVFTEHAAQRFTSRHVLDAEQRLLYAALTDTYQELSASDVHLALTTFDRTLDDGQRSLVLALSGDGKRVVVGIGPAGSGKTTAMRAYRHVLEHNGRRLIALATSSNAAKILEHELDVPTDNLHKFPYDLRTLGPAKGMAGQVRAGDVVLVDETGMAGTFNLDQLVTFASERGALVRLVGDPKQLGAVESGGALRLIVNDVGAAELTNLHRFDDPHEAQATLRLRDGDSQALGFYEVHDRILGGSRQAMIDAAYSGWLVDMRAGKVTLMTASTNHTVSVLSARARAERVSEGHVEAAGVGLYDGNVAGIGDWIVTRQNVRTLSVNGGRDFVKNGDGWRVLERYADGRLRAQHLAHKGCVILPSGYVASQVELLYAVTTNRAQGSTVDTAHAIVSDEMARENLYVAATRARSRTTLYVTTHELLPLDEDLRLDRSRFDADALAAREVLESVLTREHSEKSATQTIRDNQNRAESLALLVPRLRHVMEQTDAGEDAVRSRLLPWLSVPAVLSESPEDRYLFRLTEQVRSRIGELTELSATVRPNWTAVFGSEPTQAAAHTQWVQAMRTVAAYREQYEVQDDDSDRPLGPYVDEGRAGHRAYWAAAEAIICLRRADSGTSTGSGAAAVFHALTPAERGAVTSELADRLGPLWFGSGDHDAVRQIYDGHLAEVLRSRGHVTEPPLTKWRGVDQRMERIRVAREAERAAYRAHIAEGRKPRPQRTEASVTQPRPTPSEPQNPPRVNADPQSWKPALDRPPRPS